MKKFLSYLLILVMTVVVSATITIRVKSNLLENSQVSISADASSETTLLGGVMNSLEKNSKLNINGTVNVDIDGTKLDIDLNVDADLTVLTSPEIKGNVGISVGGDVLDVYVVFKNNTIYLNHKDISLKASIDGIKDVVQVFKDILNNNTATTTAISFDGIADKLSGLDLDALMDALNNPKKSTADDLDIYDIELGGICDVTLVCDQEYNIKTVSISNFGLIDNVSVEATLNVNQDDNIVVEEPTGYLDVAEVIKDVANLIQEDYLKVDLWASLYEDNKILEYVKAQAKIDLLNKNFAVDADITGFVDGTISAKYVEDAVYAKFNDIGIMANKQTISQIVDMVKNLLPQDFANVSIDTNKILEYLKDNYQTLLSNASFSANQIKLRVDLSFINENLGDVILSINVSNNKVGSINVALQFLSKYTVVLTGYISAPQSLDFDVNQEEYFDAQTILDLVDTVKNLDKLEATGKINVSVNEKTFNLDVDALVNIRDNAVSANIQGLFDMDVNLTYVGDKLYAKVNDIYVSVSKEFILSLVQNITLPELDIDKDEIISKVKEFFEKNSINDVLKLANIKLYDGGLVVDADFSLLFGKTVKICVDATINKDEIQLNSFAFEYEDIKVDGNLTLCVSNKQVELSGAENYLDIEELIDYAQTYVSADNLVVDLGLSVSKLQEVIAEFDGKAAINLDYFDFALDGQISGIIDEEVKLVYVNDNIYILVGEQKLKISKNALVEILSAAGIDIGEYVDKAEEIVQYIGTFDIKQFIADSISKIDVSALSQKKLDLSVLDTELVQQILALVSKVKINKNTIEASGDIAGINFDAKLGLNQTLDAKLLLNIGDYTITVDATVAKEAYDYSVAGNYANLSYAKEDVINLINIIKTKEFAGTASIKFGDKSYEKIDLDYALSINLEDKLVSGRIKVAVAGIDAQIDIVDNVLYISVKDVHIKATIEDIKQILSSDLVVGLIGKDITQSLDNIDISNLINQVLEYINTKRIINNISKVNNQLFISLLDGINVGLSTTENSASGYVNYNNLSVKFTLSSQPFEKPTIEEDKFVSVADVYELVENVYDYIKAEQFYLDIDATISDYHIVGYLGFDQNGLSLDISSQIFGKTINAKIVNKTVYVNFDGLKVKLTFEDAQEIFAKVVEEFDINIDEKITDIVSYVLTEDITLDGLIEKLSGFELNLDIENLINNIEVSLTQSKLSAQILGANINVNLDGNHIKDIDVSYAEEKINVSANVQVSTKQDILVETNYIDIADVLTLVEKLQSFVNADNLTISIDLSVSKLQDVLIAFVGNASVDLQNIKFALDGQVSGFIDQQVKIMFVDGQIYLSAGKQNIIISKDALVEILSAAGIEIGEYIEKVYDILPKLHDFDLIEFIKEKLNSGEELDLSSVDGELIDKILNILKNATITDSKVIVSGTIAETEFDVDLTIDDNLVVNATVGIGDYTIIVNATVAKEAYDYSVAGNYANLSYAKEDVINLINIIKTKEFAGTASIKFGDKSYEKIDLDYALSINLEDKLVSGRINVAVAGIDAQIDIVDNVLYISVKDVHIKATIEDIKQILSSELVSKLINKDLSGLLDFENIDIKAVVNKALEFVNEKTIFTSIDKQDGKLDLCILEDIYAQIQTSENLLVANIKYNDIEISATIKSSPFEKSTIEEDKFVSVADVYELVENVYDYIKAEQFYLDIDATISDYHIVGYLGFDQSGLSLDISSQIFGKTINAKIVGKTVYVNFDGLKVKLTFEDAQEIFAKVVEEFDINIDEKITDIVSYVLTEDITLDGIIEKVKGLSGDSIDIENIISSLEVGLTKEKLTAQILGANINVNLDGNHIKDIDVLYEAEKINVSANVQVSTKQDILVEEDYQNIGDIKNIIENVANVVTNTSYVGTIDLSYGSLIDISASYKIKIQDKKIYAQIETNFYGLDVSITFVENTLYIKIADIKVKLSKDDIPGLVEWINSTFDKNIELDLDNVSVDVEELLSKIDFAKIALTVSGTKLGVEYEDLSVVANVEQIINATINYKEDLSATLSLQVADVQIPYVDESAYDSYTALTDFVDSVMNLINGKKIAMNATALIYENNAVHYTATANLQIDLQDFAMNAYVQVVDKINSKTHTIKLTFKNDYWWIYYNNLKLKMAKNDVNEILAMLLKIMDIDPSGISFLKDASYNVDDVNVENLSAILPKLSFASPLELLGYLDNLSLVDGKLIADVNGQKVTTNDNATNMKVEIDTSNKKLTHILAQNLYTGVTNGEHLDLDISIVDFVGVGSPEPGNYIDISGSNELIKALVNTAELNYYEVDGSVNVTGNLKLLFNIPINLSDIPLNLKVKLDEDRKPIIKITLGEIPYVPFVTEEKRMVYIYYQDSFVYFQTVSSSQERRLKAHIDSVLDDPMYYVQFATGFTDTIMDEIQKSLDANAGHTPDLGKIINSYTVVNSRNFKISLNMGEISGDSKIGDMNIDIGVINNAETNHKNYIGTGSMSIYMPLSSIFTMTISTNTLRLINIGKVLDFASIESFINNYQFGESIVATKSSNSWSTSAGKTYTITFNSNGGTNVSSISGTPESNITLPKPSKTTTSGGDKTVYEFLGWWEDEAMVHTEYKEPVMARKNITLYAKWGNPVHYHTIYYYLDGAQISSKQAVEGANLQSISSLGLSQNRVVEKDGHKYYQQFVGFVDANGNEIVKVGTISQNVYAKYENTLVLNLHNVTVETGVGNQNKVVSAYNTEAYDHLLPDFTQVVVNGSGVTRTYRFDGWFIDSEFANTIPETMPDKDITVYAKWTCIKEVFENRLTIYDANTVVYSGFVEVGKEIVLPTTVLVNDSTKWYLDGNFSQETSLPQTMPQQDIVLYIRNKYSLVMNYYVLQNNQFVLTSKTQSVYQGATYSVETQTNKTIDYGSGIDFYRMIYTFDGYYNGSSKVTSFIMPNANLTISSKMNTQKQYKISFDVRTYKLKHKRLLSEYELSWSSSSPATPTAVFINEGETLDLSQSKYKLTRKATYSYKILWSTKTETVTLTSERWSTTPLSNYASSSSGVTSIRADKSYTMYAVWSE